MGVLLATCRPYSWQGGEMIKMVGRQPFVYLGLVLVCALLIRLHGLGDASLWLDETITINLSELPLARLWVTAFDPTPPLFYTIEKLALLFGNSEFILRFPSVIFGVATIYFVYRAALETAGQSAALAASLFLTFSSGNIEYSQEARAYALLGLCISGAFLGLIRLNAYLASARNNLSTRNFLKQGGALYLLFTLAALYTHNSAVFFVFAAQLYFLWAWLYLWGRNSRLAALWIATNALVFVLWLPWLAASIEIMGGSMFNWLQQASLAKAMTTIRAVHGFREISTGQPFLDLFVAALILAGFYALRKRPGILVLCLVTLIASAVLIWLFGFYKPVFQFRTILWGSIITAFVIGMGVARFTPGLSYSIVFLLALLGMKNTYSYFESNRAEQENWKGAARYLDREGRAGDTYLFCARYVAMSFFYYANKIQDYKSIYGCDGKSKPIRHAYFKVKNGKTRISWENDPVAISEVISGQRLWLISSHSMKGNIDRSAWIKQMLQESGFQDIDYRKFHGIEIYGFKKKHQ